MVRVPRLNIFVYIILPVLMLPLIGTIMMEAGSFGPSIGRYGFENGASLAYASFIAVVLATWAVGERIARRRRPLGALAQPRPEHFLRQFMVLLFLCNVAFLFMMLVPFGGWRVLTGAVGKGEFRTSLGAFGSIAFAVTKVVAPALLAYAASLYVTARRTPLIRLLLLANFGVVAAIGLCWGFKATSVLMVLPTLIILFWYVSIPRAAVLGVLGFAAIYTAASYFDVGTATTNEELLEYLFRRVTVILGDLAWHIWQLEMEGYHFPSYIATWSVAIGDTAFAALTGITKDNYAVWVDYHYDLLLTHLAGVDLETIQSGHSLTATPFAEAVIAFGSAGYLVFAVLTGAIIATVRIRLQSALRQQRHVSAALLATYAVMNLVPFLQGGAIVQLFHISTLVFFGGMYVMLRVVDRFRHVAVARRHGGHALQPAPDVVP